MMEPKEDSTISRGEFQELQFGESLLLSYSAPNLCALLKNETTRVLTTVSQNLCGLLSDFATPPAFLSLGPDLVCLQKQTQILKENIEYLVRTQLYGTRDAMARSTCALDECQKKYANLQHEWDDQQEQMGRMQSEVYRLRNQLQHQSQFCASLGAVMGNLVWKSSRIPAVIDLLLAGNRVGDFLSIVSGTLVSFMETYSKRMPNQSSDESQFIVSMCGIVTNLAAAPSGRQFLVTNVNGIELIDQYVRLLGKIPTPSGNCLKRLILMSLYNMSINQTGLKYLQDNPVLLQALSDSLHNDSTHELKVMSMRMLQSITFEIDSDELLQNIDKYISLSLVDEMTRGIEVDMRTVAADVLANIDRAREVVRTMEPAPPAPCGPYPNAYFMQSNGTGPVPDEAPCEPEPSASVHSNQ